jgi:hypothetical protein
MGKQNLIENPGVAEPHQIHSTRKQGRRKHARGFQAGDFERLFFALS